MANRETGEALSTRMVPDAGSRGATRTPDDYLLVLLRRDAAGRVTGFDASTPRLLDVGFTRTDN